MRDLVDNLQREVINNPGNHVATGTLGRVFIELHQYPEALDYLREAIRLQPNESEYYFSLSNALACSGRLEESLGACQRAVELNPDFMEATAGLANLYAWNFDRCQEAAEMYVRVIRKAPADSDSLDYYAGLAAACLRNVDFADGLRGIEKILEPISQPIRVREGAAIALCQEGRYDQARSCCRQLLKLSPANSTALAILAQVETEQQHDLDAAQQYYSQLLKLDPANATAHLYYLVHLARKGDFSHARERFLTVYHSFGYHHADLLGKPIWDGSRLAGKTILLNTKLPPGYGDSIQFGRSALWLKKLDAKVILESQRAVQSIVRRINGVDHVVEGYWKCPPFDCISNLVTVWFLIDHGLETAGSCVPYITAPQEAIERWKPKVSGNGELKVGIVWASSERRNRNLYTQRNIPFKELSRLWEAPGVIFYSLQVAAPENDAGNQPDTLPLIDLGRELSDFIDTAAVMTHLDLIITVDTSVAHLAGAMGLPVFLMLPFTPDWKWMLDREDNFWYPTMRLFRQPSPGAWSSVVGGIKQALESMAAQRNPA